MQKTIFKKNHFSNAALEALSLAQQIAASLEEEKVRCSHLLASLIYLFPAVVDDVLGKSIGNLLAEYKIDWELVRKSDKSVKYADELCVLLIDAAEESPLAFIKGFFPERVIGPAELAFIILKEPVEEVVDMISPLGISNDYSEFSRNLCLNYLACCEKHSAATPAERLKKCIEMGKTFSDFMNRRIIGQAQVIEQITAALIDFWYRGNHQKPLPLLLLSKTGGGNSYFAQTMQEAFVKIGLQKEVCPVLDLGCFTHSEAADSELLGADKTYKAARHGKIYEISQKNNRGIMVFENIQSGCGGAQQILKALTQNHAYDKYFQRNLILPFNVLLFTLTLFEHQHDFLMRNGTETLDAQQLIKVLCDKDQQYGSRDFSLINTVQDIFCLKELDEQDLKKMIQMELKSLGGQLQEDYRISLECTGEEDFCNLLLQSFPHNVTPKELKSVISKHFSGIGKSVVKHPGIRCIEIRCGKLPDYPHEISRRTARGDYLTFQKSETCDNERCTISLGSFQYITQESIECGAYRIERPKNISLNDIIGLDSVKSELQDALDYITGKYNRISLPPPPLAFILEGPPGGGKTAMITALASSCGIPVFFANNAVFSDARKIDDLFSKAKKMSPAIVVMDELNSIGRSDQPWKVDAINALLSHMDGVEESAKLLVLGSTNYVNQIEVALRRPGRFSRIVHVGPPKAESREMYIRKFESKYSFKLEEKDRKYFVRLTEGKTIAVMKGVLEHALRKSIRTGEVLNSAGLESAYHHITGQENRESSRAIGFNGEC